MNLRLSALASLLIALPASALTFQPRLERVEWTVVGDRFECRLSQPIAGFGEGEFLRKAGEEPTFRLRTREPWFAEGAATLVAAAAPWQPGLRDIPLGQVSVRGGEIPLDSSHQQAGRLLSGLLEGRSPVVRHRTRHGGDPLEVRLLPARFAKAYDDYLACAAKLLPVNYEQVRQTRLGFPSAGSTDLDAAAKARLDIVLEYVKADPAINRFLVEGHSDNGGDRLTNRELSRRRALAVRDYLMANGVPDEQITVRFHGERYPLAPNNSPANRATNRRVTLQLDKETAMAAAAPGATAAESAPTPAAPAAAGNP